MIFNLCLGYRVDGQRQLPQSRQEVLILDIFTLFLIQCFRSAEGSMPISAATCFRVFIASSLFGHLGDYTR